MPTPIKALQIVIGYTRSFLSNVKAFYLWLIKPALDMLARFVRLWYHDRQKQ